MSRSSYDISVFSPEGRLYQVEYSFKTLAHEALTNVGLTGEGCAVVVCQKKVPDKLLKEDSITHVFKAAKDIGMAMSGRVPDCASVVDDTRHETMEFAHDFGYDCDVAWLAKRMGEKAQISTQRAGLRPLGAGTILFGMEMLDSGEQVPRIFTIDPAGLVIAYKATSMGQKDNEVKLNLEKQYKPNMSLDDTIMTGIQCLQKSLGSSESNLTAADLEVAVVTADNTKVRFLDATSVEEYITKIVERD
eukprot:TRINITY_DN33522_c0_g1_i1.p1 TRINITY_DN33522_c0_g1~~TRINITY_DN33522_c0_g1_i1.p1  ORF type:complete len:264 (+),score=77.83 TRINITY_DN33522_c0_g1_i1:52-792(+)